MSEQDYLVDSTDSLLGQEFLTWLWFRGETSPLGFTDSNGRPFSLLLDQKVVVQGGEGDMRETTSVTGGMTDGIHLPLREARLGLLTGKKVTRALLLLEQDGIHWQMTLKADDFAPGAFRTPKIESDKDDQEAAFLEKMFVIEQGLTLLDTAYKVFLEVRLSSKWDQEVRSIGSWMTRQE